MFIFLKPTQKTDILRPYMTHSEKKIVYDQLIVDAAQLAEKYFGP
jgi:hypothetical protein